MLKFGAGAGKDRTGSESEKPLKWVPYLAGIHP